MEWSFSTVMFLDYYDGPTTGAVQCQACAATYAFRMLAIDHDGLYDPQAWDTGQEVRIFSLAPLPISMFGRFEEALSQPEARRRCVEDESLYSQIAALLDAAGVPEVVVATSGLDAPILAAREIDISDLVTVQDWFSFLGTVRQPV